MANVSKPEVWLRPNQRALRWGLVLPGLLTLLGVVLLATAGNQATVQRAAGAVLAAMGIFLCAVLLRELRRPRLAYQDGALLVNLGPRAVHSVPVEVVEAFFAARGPSHLPGPYREVPSANLVVRLAESARDYAHREVKPALGSWSDSYVTLRGTWCEPIDCALIDRLNRRLAEVQRDHPRVKVTT